MRCGSKCYNQGLNKGPSDGGYRVRRRLSLKEGNSLMVNEPVSPRS